MRWKKGRRSTNVDDRRGRTVRRPAMAVGGGGGVILLVLLGAMFFGVDPGDILRLLSGGQPPTSSGIERPGLPAPGTQAGAPDEQSDFVSVVLADTEDTWSQLLPQIGRRYEPPTLVLFSGMVQSACGLNSAAVGPFYCPGDRKVYIDLGFFRQLSDRFGAPGDFAQAYVIAHEVGHHIQNLLGISSEVHSRRARMSKGEGNALSVLQELQADCLAGVWGYHANAQRALLEAGDVEEGLRAAAAIGDDRLQRQSTGAVRPESWTHGSSEQRVTWFRRGMTSGRMDACDTFAENP